MGVVSDGGGARTDDIGQGKPSRLYVPGTYPDYPLRSTELLMSSPSTATHPEPDHQAAVFVPNVARALLALMQERGEPPDGLCRGLGFQWRDLVDLDMRLSYRQTRLLILRAKRTTHDPVLGLASGARQTPVSWGLAGLAMLTCRTLGEAIAYGLDHQGDTGALMEHRAGFRAREFEVEVRPKVFDLEIQPFLVEEAFSSAVAVVRRLVGPAFSPSRVELAYARPPHADAYARMFRCPVRFGGAVNRMLCDAHWLQTQLPDYDEVICGAVRAQLDRMLERPSPRRELVQSLLGSLRGRVDEAHALGDIAEQFNCSDRTLRRRLASQGANYRGLRDQVRHERAADLLRHTGMSVAEVAQAVGFADARSFRRAFKRWTGRLPGEARDAALPVPG